MDSNYTAADRGWMKAAQGNLPQPSARTIIAEIASSGCASLAMTAENQCHCERRRHRSAGGMECRTSEAISVGVIASKAKQSPRGSTDRDCFVRLRLPRNDSRESMSLRAK